MGQSLCVLCYNCKTNYYLGYGGKITHDSLWEKFRCSHDMEHIYDKHYDDYTRSEGGKLWGECYGYAEDYVIVEDYDKWKQEKFQTQYL